jgi:hypothetical protein
METATGAVLSGEQAQAHAQPLAYGGHPCEHVAFIGCHDNLTMFDAVCVDAGQMCIVLQFILSHATLLMTMPHTGCPPRH